MSARKREKAAACHQKTLARQLYNREGTTPSTPALIEPPEDSPDPRVRREAVRNLKTLNDNFATHSFAEQQRQLDNRYKTNQ